MTTIDDRPKADAGATVMRRRPGRIWAVLGVTTLLVVPGVVVAIVRAVDSAALTQVHVFLDARSFDCADPEDVTTVTTGDFERDDDSAYRLPAVKAGPDLDCRMSVVIRNDSDRDVRVDRVEFPLYGPQNGSGLHVDRSFTQGLAPSGRSDGPNAVFDYAGSAPIGVGAHDVLRFDFHLSWSNGCMDDGSFQSTDDAPLFAVSTGIGTAVITTEGPGWALAGTDKSVSATC